MYPNKFFISPRSISEYIGYKAKLYSARLFNKSLRIFYANCTVIQAKNWQNNLKRTEMNPVLLFRSWRCSGCENNTYSISFLRVTTCVQAAIRMCRRLADSLLYFSDPIIFASWKITLKKLLQINVTPERCEMKFKLHSQRYPLYSLPYSISLLTPFCRLSFFFFARRNRTKISHRFKSNWSAKNWPRLVKRRVQREKTFFYRINLLECSFERYSSLTIFRIFRPLVRYREVKHEFSQRTD